MSTNIEALLQFLAASPSPYHATQYLSDLFQKAGFTLLNEADDWALTAGGRYVYIRADASISAFCLSEDILERGIRVVGAHTDSPCLKVKPSPELNTLGYSRLGVEVYGGALLNPWFDRDLSIAGKVSGISPSGTLVSTLIDFNKAIAVIPSLAIHLNRDANKNKSVNPQKEMNAILSGLKDDMSFRDLLLQHVNEQTDSPVFREILDFNLSFYDVQKPAVVGLYDEFIASARLDNLLSCYLSAESLIQSQTNQTAIVIFHDHEEVGSRSESGAQGTMLQDLLTRLVPRDEDRQRMLRHSMMLSVDNAHGIHPNYPERHDEKHGPLINAGPVIKFDADQSYATSSDTAALVKWLAMAAEPPLPLQSFVTRADCRCGSTIGPITASNIGIKTIDIGNAQFAMHSCRELAGVADAHTMQALLQRFYHAEDVNVTAI